MGRELTQEIVQRIAARLVSESGEVAPLSIPVVPAAAPVAAPTPPPEAPAETAPVEEEEDDVIVSDDAYVDTPLCTSCNECTKINSQLFEYDGNKQAFIKNASAGAFKDLVTAAEKCPVIVFGCSYAGQLAAYFRLKYPHITIGAVGSSAPVFDNDGIIDYEDNCQFAWNPDQLDFDGDGLGNACDSEPGQPPAWH